MKGRIFRRPSVTSAPIPFLVQGCEGKQNKQEKKKKKTTKNDIQQRRDGGRASTKRLKIMDVNWIKWAGLAVRSELPL